MLLPLNEEDNGAIHRMAASPGMPPNISGNGEGTLVTQASNNSETHLGQSSSEVVFCEDFEGAFPGDKWWVGDWNDDCGDD